MPWISLRGSHEQGEQRCLIGAVLLEFGSQPISGQRVDEDAAGPFIPRGTAREHVQGASDHRPCLLAAATVAAARPLGKFEQEAQHERLRKLHSVTESRVLIVEIGGYGREQILSRRRRRDLIGAPAGAGFCGADFGNADLCVDHLRSLVQMIEHPQQEEPHVFGRDIRRRSDEAALRGQDGESRPPGLAITTRQVGAMKRIDPDSQVTFLHEGPQSAILLGEQTVTPRCRQVYENGTMGTLLWRPEIAP